MFVSSYTFSAFSLKRFASTEDSESHVRSRRARSFAVAFLIGFFHESLLRVFVFDPNLRYSPNSFNTGYFLQSMAVAFNSTEILP